MEGKRTGLVVFKLVPLRVFAFFLLEGDGHTVALRLQSQHKTTIHHSTTGQPRRDKRSGSSKYSPCKWMQRDQCHRAGGS